MSTRVGIERATALGAAVAIPSVDRRLIQIESIVILVRILSIHLVNVPINQISLTHLAIQKLKWRKFIKCHHVRNV